MIGQVREKVDYANNTLSLGARDNFLERACRPLIK
jgi:hypothetical protein